MMPVQQGRLGGMHYSVIATIPLRDQGRPAPSSALIIRVELPFRSKVHMLGIPVGKHADQLAPTKGRSAMEEVHLEGDYYNYFSLYCGKGMQTEVRYVLDPAGMAFTVDFCRSHSWEIIMDELYFLQSGQNLPDDPSSLWDDVVQFVQEIKPAVEVKNSPTQNKLRTPYGQDRRTNLKCPLCKAVLINHQTFFACPNNDGVLAFASLLFKIRNNKDGLKFVPSPASTIRSYDIHCPSCGNQMTRTPYLNSPTIVDTCTRCPYRWLDSVELAKAV